MPDHIHILIGVNPIQSLSDLMKDVKGSSSKWINEKKFNLGKFHWQNIIRKGLLKKNTLNFLRYLRLNSIQNIYLKRMKSYIAPIGANID